MQAGSLEKRKRLSLKDIKFHLTKIRNNQNIIIANNLLSNVEILEDTNCWILNKDWSNYSKHRLSYKLFIGDIIKGNFICHQCDRKGCINYSHLFQGTASDNSRDSRRKRSMFKLAVNKVKRSKVKSWKDISEEVQILIDAGLIEDTFIKVRE